MLGKLSGQQGRRCSNIVPPQRDPGQSVRGVDGRPSWSAARRKVLPGRRSMWSGGLRGRPQAPSSLPMAEVRPRSRKDHSPACEPERAIAGAEGLGSMGQVERPESRRGKPHSLTPPPVHHAISTRYLSAGRKKFETSRSNAMARSSETSGWSGTPPTEFAPLGFSGGAAYHSPRLRAERRPGAGGAGSVALGYEPQAPRPSRFHRRPSAWPPAASLIRRATRPSLHVPDVPASHSRRAGGRVLLEDLLKVLRD